MDRGRFVSDDDEPSSMEEAAEGRNDVNKCKKASIWQRVKWSDSMVRLLITAASYITEDAATECTRGQGRKVSVLLKKGKWKSVSKAMAERGHFVSPQQCEDKFNDLNKRYKRLNEILGRGTSCEVVENPSLLDVIYHISEKGKEEVRKILSSKHLHYEEMCSYHNGNRLHLPPDPELQQSLILALIPRDDQDGYDAKRHLNDEYEEANHEAEFDDHDVSVENQESDHMADRVATKKRAKQLMSNEDFGLKSRISSRVCKTTEFAVGDANKSLSDGTKTLQEQWTNCRNIQLEEQKLHIQTQMLELEKERFKWQQYCQKQDTELEMMKMENERMKLENERMALELRQKEIGVEDN